MISTWAKVILVSAFLVPGVAANHNSGTDIGGLEVDGSGLGFPEYDSTAEIVSFLVAPFLLITLLFKALFFIVFTQIVDAQGTQNYGRITTMMSLSATALLVPSPFWDYVLLAVGSLASLSFATVLIALLLIIYRVIDYMS